MCCGPANRGVAVSDGKVYIGTVDARLIALSAKTGKIVWDIEVANSESSKGENVSSLNDSDPLKKEQLPVSLELVLIWLQWFIKAKY